MLPWTKHIHSGEQTDGRCTVPVGVWIPTVLLDIEGWLGGGGGGGVGVGGNTEVDGFRGGRRHV